MKTLEILFTNRRKEKLTAETISLTEAPGWVILKTGGEVAEMIPAHVIKRIKFVAAHGDETATKTSAPIPCVTGASHEHDAATPPPIPDHLLKLPMRPPCAEIKRMPLVPSRRYA